MMTIIPEYYHHPYIPLSSSTDAIAAFFSQMWEKLNHPASIVEVGVIVCIALLSFFLQKWLKGRYIHFITCKERSRWSQRILFAALSFITPLLVFALLSFAMTLTTAFTQNLEVYELSIKLTLVWFAWLLIVHTIVDPFIQWIVSFSLIPLLIFSTLGLSNHVFNYLDSLGFPLAGIHISIFVILKGLLIATCLFWFARLICQGAISFIESQKKINPQIRDLMQNLFQVILYTTVILITCDLIGLDLKSLAIIGGAIGIGIGLGLQKIAANFISGIIILFEQNVKIGHLVEIPGRGNPGWVRHLGARAVVIDTGDGRELLIPNEELLTTTLIDWTLKDYKVRTDLQIKISYQSNLEKTQEIILEVATEHPLCSKSLPPFCYLEKFTDNGAQFSLQFWVDDISLGKIKMDMQNDILLSIWKRFGNENIEFAVPPLLNPFNWEGRK